jgi:hypothetical protein
MFCLQPQPSGPDPNFRYNTKMPLERRFETNNVSKTANASEDHTHNSYANGRIDWNGIC